MRFASILFIALFMLILAPLFATAADDGPPAAILARAALALASVQAPRPPQAPAVPRAGTQTCDCGGTASCVCSPDACACPSCTSLACATRRAERKAARQAGATEAPVYDAPLAAYESAVYPAPVRQTYYPMSNPSPVVTYPSFPAWGTTSPRRGGVCVTGH